MFKKLSEDIKKYLISKYPQEGCGLIIGSNNSEVESFLPCQNVADNPTESFQIQRKIRKEYEDKIKGVVHSHPNGLLCPSAADMSCQLDWMVPWGIARTIKDDCSELFWFGDQSDKEKLIGRGFRHGVTDCYGLIRDWYALEKNIRLKDFPRNWRWWKDAGVNLYESCFGKAGFSKLKTSDTPQSGDIALLKIRSKVINHALLLVDQDIIIHHAGGAREYEPDKLSTREPVGKWQQYIEYWIRLHEAFKPEKID